MTLIVCLAIACGFFAGAFAVTGAGLYLENRAENKKLEKELQRKLDADKSQPILAY